MSRRDLPAGQHDAVVRALYAAAEQLNWEHLPLTEHTTQYAKWINDPAVGGVLTRYMTSEQSRSWIKDGPMKEYTRARRGTGRYAEFGQTGGTGPGDVVRAGLGKSWKVVDGTTGTKPLHCLAENDGATAYVAWGSTSNFKHLVWAALRASINEGLRAVIVVTDTLERPTPEDERAWHERVAQRCDFEVAHMRERLGAGVSPGPAVP